MLVSGLLLIWLTASAQADQLYQTGDHGTDLYVTDTTNGASALIGSFGYSGVWGDAFSPSGQLYAIIDSLGGRLATVNIATGAATPVGLVDNGDSDMMAIQFAPNGILYAASWSTNSLYTVDTSTGARTLVGSLGMPGSVMDLAWDYQNNEMYAIASNGPGGTNDNQSLLYTVDLTTGAGTLVTNISGDPCLMGLAIDHAGDFLATDLCSSNSALYQIDPSTGNLTNLGLTGINGTMGGDIFQGAPEPATWSLLIAGLAAAAVCGKKRRA